ncbi:MAG: hypothetical protein ACI97N_002484 [Cognaticolwellia sp.]|jgi:hypothetical protein
MTFSSCGIKQFQLFSRFCRIIFHLQINKICDVLRQENYRVVYFVLRRFGAYSFKTIQNNILQFVI